LCFGKSSILNKANSLLRQQEVIMIDTYSEIINAWKRIFPNKNFSPKDSFLSIGGNSKLADNLFSNLEAIFGSELKISTTIAYDYPTIEKQAAYITNLLQSPNKRSPFTISKSKKENYEPIAIIGMACRFPAGANTPQAYWQQLIEGSDVLEEIPPSRWDINAYFNPDHKAHGKMVTRKGGFITDLDQFDALFFHISPKEAVFLDPNQRIALETSWHALQDASIDPSSLEDSNTGVFLGVMFHDYDILVERADLKQENLGYLNIGTSAGAVAGRVSYCLGLQGPSMVIDTACSSSLVALHEACQHLHNHECHLALAGGVNLMLLPEVSISFSQANMLSPDNCCKSFSDDANGYVRSEGCGIIVLKRLSDAQKDGDKILAVIKSSTVNQDGASSGMTAPNRLAQEKLLVKALELAAITPDDVDYLEAHGTGTPLGDPIEIGAINTVYQGRNTPLYIGSVKSNIGHLEAAAGVAGLIKVILSLQHEIIPANLHFKALNRRIHLEDIPAEIVTKQLAWQKSDKARCAGVSSFGFTGTNAHVIIEEAPLQDSNALKPAIQLTQFNHQRFWLKALDDANHFDFHEWKTALVDLTKLGKLDIADGIWLIVKDKQNIVQGLIDKLEEDGIGYELIDDNVTFSDLIAKLTQENYTVAGIIDGSQIDRVERFTASDLKAQLSPISLPYFYRLRMVDDIIIDSKINLTQLGLNDFEQQLFNQQVFPFSILQWSSQLPLNKIIKNIWTELLNRKREKIVHFNKKRYILREVVEEEATVAEEDLISVVPQHDISSIEKITNIVREQALTVLGLPVNVPTYDDVGFFNLGMDSLIAAGLGRRIKKLFPNVAFDITITFDYPTIIKLSHYIEAQLSSKQPLVETSQPSFSYNDEPIAIVGMSCRFPGGANSIEEFWDLLEQGFDAGTVIPKNRWNMNAYYDTEIDHDGKIYVNRAGLVSLPIDEFDAEFFGISPREAEYLDPQHRILLEETWVALENSGIKPSNLRETDTSVFLGICSHDYLDLLESTTITGINSYAGTGNAASTAAGRISYIYGLQGASIAIDTACSSSLVAVHQACQNLRAKESNIAIAGGINAILAPDFMATLCRMHMLSPSGCCKTFDKDADGFMHAEGCGILILKRLKDAQENGDSILAIIKGSAINQDGATSGLTVPNGLAQEKVIKRALQQAKIAPHQVDFIEMHGTGTSIGDPIEVNALNRIFSNKENNKREHPLIIGTVKSNIGHLEAAAGVAGVIKTVLTLQNEKIPPHLHFKQLNPEINLEKIPAKIPLESIEWHRRENHIRRAGVSSFGFSGTNAHLIIEEANKVEAFTMPNDVQEELNNQLHLLQISAKNQAALTDQIYQYIDYLKQSKASIQNICYTSQVAREQFDNQVAVAGKTIEDLISNLEKNAYIAKEDMQNPLYCYSDKIRPFLKKTPLPTYPFQRDRYWANCIKSAEFKGLGFNIRNDQHPWLQHEVFIPNNFKNGKTWLYETYISEIWPGFINDHLIFNTPVIAGATYVSAILFWIKKADVGLLAIEEMNFLEAMVIEPGKQYHVQTLIESNNEHYEFSIYSCEQSELESEWRLHVQGKLIHNTKELPNSNEALFKRLLSTGIHYDKSRHQTLFKNLSITLGEKFHWLDEAFVLGHEVLAKFRQPTAEEENGSHIIHPGLIDSIFQSAFAAFSGYENGDTTPHIPFTLKKLYFDQKQTDLPTWCHILFEEIPEQKIVKTNAKLYNQQFVCVGEIFDLVERSAPKEKLMQALFNQDKTKKWLYCQAWYPCDLLYGNDKNNNEIITFDARVQGMQWSCVSFNLNLLEFLQDLIRKNTTNCQVNIITEQAYSLFNEKINLNQSSLNGFIKTAIIEHPELNIRQIDIEENQDVNLLNEIFVHMNPAEQIIAFRHSKWYGVRIRKQEQYNNDYKLLNIPLEKYKLVKSQDGLLDNLKLINTDTTILLADDEVAIEPKAVGLNFRDVLNAMNLYPGDPGPLGSDVAGVIIAVGEKVQRFKVGDETMGFGIGCLASYVITHQDNLIHKPLSFNFGEAASTPIVFLTAYQGLIDMAQLKEGETVLIHAATGGVGLAAIQIAKYVKANIFATVGSEEKRAYLHRMGVNHVFSSRELNYGDEIQRVTNGKGVDVVLNSLSGPGFIETSLLCCANNARFIEIGKRDIWTKEQVKMKRADVQYHVVALDDLIINSPAEIQHLLNKIMPLFANKILKPIPITCFSLSQAILAFKNLQQAKHIGKVIINLPPSEIKFDKKSSYLITGGLGGIGLEMAKFLSKKNVGRIILAARSKPSVYITEIIEQMQQKGTTVLTCQTDISDKEQTRALLVLANSEDYPLKGIFHAAGSIADAPIVKQTAQSFDNAFAAKAKGAWYLHELTTKMSITLEYFVLFSSIASLKGSAAQSNYAAANSFLDGLAYHRIQQGLKAQTINWGPWSQVGMAKDLISLHQRQGLIALKPEQAMESFEQILRQDNVQQAVAIVNWQKMAEQLSNIPSWLSELAIADSETLEVLEELANISVTDREKVLKKIIKEEVRKTLDLVNSQSINDDKGFFEMGMDSLMALELKNRLQTLISQPLENTIAFDYPTITDLIKYIMTLPIKNSKTVKKQDIFFNNKDFNIDKLKNNIESLSDEDVYEKLLSKIGSFPQDIGDKDE